MKLPPLTWFVVNVVTGADGRPVALFGRASYDGSADLLTVSTITRAGRRSETTQGGGSELQALAKLLLSEMHRNAWQGP